MEKNGRIWSLAASSVAEEGCRPRRRALIVDVTEREQAEQQRQEFTANVSHELKTPLTSIMGYAEIIEAGIAKPADVVPFAGKIRTEAQRLLSLIEDIIRLSQLDAGGEEIPFEPIELQPLCCTVRSRLQSKADRLGLKTNVRAKTRPFPVSAERSSRWCSTLRTTLSRITARTAA